MIVHGVMSPDDVAAIEALVADTLAAEPSTPIDELVERARRRLPFLDAATLADVVDRLAVRARGLGRVEDLLALPGVTEVMVNGPGPVWVERAGAMERTSISLDRGDITVLIERILGPLGLRVDPLSPTVDARLRDGSRVNVVVAPVAIDGPVVTIRRFATTAVPLSGFGPPEMVGLLERLVVQRATILVVGGTGAGKTTLLNALASAVPAASRVVTVEDTAELRLPGDHVVRLEARRPNREGGGEITVRDLVRNALRMRPDRLIIGEVRGAEALDLLLALNTGHAGSFTTCHANGPSEGLRRLETLALLGGTDVPLGAVRRQMLDGVDAVVHVVRDGSERRVESIDEVDPEDVATHRVWPAPDEDPVRPAVRRAVGTSGNGIGGVR